MTYRFLLAIGLIMVTMPEATARITDDQVAPARSPARPLIVRPGPPG